MNHPVRLGCLFVLIVVGEPVPVCRNPYLDLCVYNGEGYNTTETEGSNDDNICNCSQETFCSLIELSEECKSATILLSVDGNITAFTRLHCDISALDSQTQTTVYNVSNKTKNEFTVKVFTKYDFGRFRVVCDAFEILDEFNASNESQWDILSVTPAEVMVDSQTQLQITTAAESDINLTETWCFVKTPDDNIEILSTSWTSGNQVDCNGFSPTMPGRFMISLSSFISENIFDTTVSVKVTSKHPVAQTAEYSYDFESIFIHFNENIELQSTCASVFPEGCHEYFGIGFECSTRGNVLFVKMGRQFKIINEITITADSKICQAGCQSAEFCLGAQPVTLVVLKPKVSGPNLSFYINAACVPNSTQKHMSVRVMPSKRFDYITENHIVPHKNSGKEQRKNLIMWRMMRRFQSKLSSRQVVMEFNSTDIPPVFENLTELDNALDADENLGSAANVSVVIQSSTGTSSVLVEANVEFCESSTKLIRYNWVVNGSHVSEDGKLLVLRDLEPGKYIIKCVVVDYNSSEVLGQGWTTTEIPPTEEKPLIIPSEITVGKTDSISLRVETWHGSSVSWTCKTNFGELCRTSDKKLVSDITNLNSQNISVPAGTLPVGIYVWTVENSRGSNNATVFIKDGNVTSVGVEIPSVFVKPSEEVVVLGVVGRLQSGCQVWWSSVRQNGFNYLDLKTAGIKTEASIREGSSARIPLAIPSDSEIWKNAVPDAQYLFQLQVFCPHSVSNPGGSFDHLKVPIVVSDPPRISPPTIEPLSGEAMVTKFTISGAEAVGNDQPLMYEWSYVDPCNSEVPIGRGAFRRNFTTYLPPGDLKLMVKVCNGKEICVTASSPTIDVIQGSDFPGDNFHNARNQIRYLMRSGDILEAFGLAITTLRSLAFLSEREIREEIFSTIEETITNRISHLNERLRSDRKHINSCLDFFERAVKVAEYFRKGSDILTRLTEFREGVLMSVNSGEKY